MRTRLVLATALLAALFLYSCGGQSTTLTVGQQPGSHSPIPFFNGPGMLAAAPDDFELSAEHQVSNTYVKFYGDSVNAQSSGRWVVTDWSGNKTWTLSNTAFSAPKAWVIGQNYWNRSEDDLTANSFAVPDQTDGLRVSFYARYRMGVGDHCELTWFDGVNWSDVHSFQMGQNPSYPGWDKYYFELPANFSGQLQFCDINFKFLSDTSGNDWGFGVDSVAVYQRQLEPPLNVTASDALPAMIVVNWSLNDAGTLKPDFFDVYRSNTPGGPYSLQGSVPYPGTSYTDFAPPFSTFYYILRSRKTGYPDSADSNEDSGMAL